MNFSAQSSISSAQQTFTVTQNFYLIKRCINDVGTTFVWQDLLRRHFFSWNFSILHSISSAHIELTKTFSLMNFSSQSQNFLSSANLNCHTFRLFDKSMQQRCRKNFCPARIVEEKVFLLKLFILCCESSADIEINEEISLFSFSAQSQNFFSSADFCCDTDGFFAQSMQQWCRNNFCPATLQDGLLFLLKLFNLCCESSAHIEINERNFSCRSPLFFKI